MKSSVVTAALLATVISTSAVGRADAQSAKRLTELTLEQLGSVMVTTVSKEPEEVWSTPAAIAVITQDDIRRSGATSIPEILRLAPGVEVARIDSGHWSVGVRGFGDAFSKALLVLIDGRSLYTPLFAGVYWAVQDTPLEDIDRIEIIRGPGATTWGTNAVNGVINIITKRAAETRGTLAAVQGGGPDYASGTIRYGGGSDTFGYRVYGKAFALGPQSHRDPTAFDRRDLQQGGFRTDWQAGITTSLTVQGDAYIGTQGQRVSLASFAPPAQIVVDGPVDVAGGNLLAKWQRTTGRHDVGIQAYYDHVYWLAPQFGETRNTVDLDVVHGIALPRSQRVRWGVGARWSPSTFTQTVPTLDVTPNRQTDTRVSAFVQHEIGFARDRVHLTAGAKIEHNNYTGLEVLPDARVLWRITSVQSAWAAVSRAVRIPSRIEDGLRLTGLVSSTPAIFLQVTGNTEFDSERLLGVEAGYRVLVAPRLYVDVSGFHHDHDSLASFKLGAVTLETTPSPAHALIRFPYVNGIEGTGDGFELAPDWSPTRWWRLHGSYSHLRFDLKNKPGDTDVGAVITYEGSSPRHQVTVQSRMDLPRAATLDVTYRGVGALFANDTRPGAKPISEYHTADLRLAWRPGRQLELSLVGQNLLQPHHAEFNPSPGPTVGIQRAAYVGVTWDSGARTRP